MASRREAGVAARTELALAIVIALAAPARAAPGDAEIIGHDRGWLVEDVELWTTYVGQHGRGFQAQGEPSGQPGSEYLWLIEPVARITVRQSDRIVHEVIVPVDVITAASPDAVDATTQASLRNVSEDIDVRTAIRTSDTATVTTRVSAHHEEPLSSGTLGGGYKRELADGNATIAITGSLTVDGFDRRDHLGQFLGKTARETANANLAVTQLLSPTTVLDASYGVTYQNGTMDIGWNSVPTNAGGFGNEVLPTERLRHAWSVRLAQHVPQTHSTAKAWYRYYLDDWGARAHTIELALYQYVVDWLYVRGGYRFHHQTGVDFFTTQVDAMMPLAPWRTADSDLAPFDANEWSVELATIRARGPLRAWSVSAEVMRYTRTNDLNITAVSFGLGRAL